MKTRQLRLKDIAPGVHIRCRECVCGRQREGYRDAYITIRPCKCGAKDCLEAYHTGDNSEPFAYFLSPQCSALSLQNTRPRGRWTWVGMANRKPHIRVIEE